MKNINFGHCTNKLPKVILNRCLFHLLVSQIQARQKFGVNIKADLNSKHKKITLN